MFLSLIHSERHLVFPYLNELIEVSTRFSSHELFSFDLTFASLVVSSLKRRIDAHGREESFGINQI